MEDENWKPIYLKGYGELLCLPFLGSKDSDRPPDSSQYWHLLVLLFWRKPLRCDRRWIWLYTRIRLSLLRMLVRKKRRRAFARPTPAICRGCNSRRASSAATTPSSYSA